MAYEPQTEEGKAAIAAGADPSVVEQQEADGELVDGAKTPEAAPAEAEPPKPEGEAEPPKVPGEGEGESERPPEREARHIPAWKHKEELKQLEKTLREEFSGELQRELARLSTQEGGSTPEDAAKIAEEFGLTPESATALLDRMAKVVETRLDITGLKRDNEARKESDKKNAEQQQYQAEMASAETQNALKAVAGDRPITQEVLAKLAELAYTSTYTQYRLTDIIRLEAGALFPEPQGPAPTAERGRGGAARAPAAPKTLDDVTPDQIDAMSDEEFREFSTRIGGSGSRFSRTDAPKRT